MTDVEHTGGAPDAPSNWQRARPSGRVGAISRILWTIARDSYRKRLFKAVQAAIDERKPALAVKRLRHLALLGDRDAQFELGNCYVEGRGVVRNIADAMMWMRLAAEQGHIGAQGYLGHVLSNGVAPRQFYDPVRWYGEADEPARENGGHLFPNGLHIAPDADAGFEWFRRAGEQGHPLAQVHLAMRYATGNGVEKDEARALELLRASAEKNCAEAHLTLGRAYRSGELVGHQDPEAAVRHLTTAAEAGDVTAAFELAALRSSDGPMRDEDEAARWFTMAAERGHVLAQINIANFHRRGIGLPQNFYNAASWYRRAAKSNHPVALLNMGRLHEMGLGVERDLFEASEWYLKAAKLGNAQAQFNLAAIYFRGQGVVRDIEKAAQWFLEAAKQGHVEARVNLGMMHMHGRLTPSDPVRALMWFDLGRTVATPDQVARIDEVKKTLAARLSPEQIARAEDLVREWSPERAEA